MTEPRIVLVMNAKDRPEIVRRAIESVRPLIVGAIVSVEPGDPLGREILAINASLNLPSRVFAFDRVNGGQMRSDLFTYAERHRAQFGATHWINVDADDEIEITGVDQLAVDAGFTWPSTIFDEPVFNVREVDPLAVEWTFPRIFRAGLGWTWRYPLHEIPLCRAAPLDPYTVPPTMPGLTYIRHTDTHTGPERYARHAEIIEAWLKRPGCAYDPRMRWYLGISYRAAGDLEKAERAFEAHVDLGFECEATWYSRYMIARCREALRRDPETVVAAYERAIAMRSSRAEPMHHLATYLRELGRFGESAAWAERATQLPRPFGEVCFVEGDVYDWRALDGFAMSALQAGASKEAVAEAWGALLCGGALPPSEVDRVAQNIAAIAVAPADAHVCVTRGRGYEQTTEIPRAIFNEQDAPLVIVRDAEVKR